MWDVAILLKQKYWYILIKDNKSFTQNLIWMIWKIYDQNESSFEKKLYSEIDRMETCFKLKVGKQSDYFLI